MTEYSKVKQRAISHPEGLKAFSDCQPCQCYPECRIDCPDHRQCLERLPVYKQVRDSTEQAQMTTKSVSWWENVLPCEFFGECIFPECLKTCKNPDCRSLCHTKEQKLKKGPLLDLHQEKRISPHS